VGQRIPEKEIANFLFVAEKRIVELSPDEARLLREALLAFRNKLLSAGKPTEDVNELIIKVMK
jgi:hypothetical protein